jgi:hypothetical protein
MSHRGRGGGLSGLSSGRGADGGGDGGRTHRSGGGTGGHAQSGGGTDGSQHHHRTQYHHGSRHHHGTQHHHNAGGSYGGGRTQAHGVHLGDGGVGDLAGSDAGRDSGSDYEGSQGRQTGDFFGNGSDSGGSYDGGSYDGGSHYDSRPSSSSTWFEDGDYRWWEYWKKSDIYRQALDTCYTRRLLPLEVFMTNHSDMEMS